MVSIAQLSFLRTRWSSLHKCVSVEVSECVDECMLVNIIAAITKGGGRYTTSIDRQMRVNWQAYYEMHNITLIVLSSILRIGSSSADSSAQCGTPVFPVTDTRIVLSSWKEANGTELTMFRGRADSSGYRPRSLASATREQVSLGNSSTGVTPRSDRVNDTVSTRGSAKAPSAATVRVLTRVASRGCGACRAKQDISRTGNAMQVRPSHPLSVASPACPDCNNRDKTDGVAMSGDGDAVSDGESGCDGTVSVTGSTRDEGEGECDDHTLHMNGNHIITAVRVRPMFASERKRGCRRIIDMAPEGDKTTESHSSHAPGSDEGKWTRIVNPVSLSVACTSSRSPQFMTPPPDAFAGSGSVRPRDFAAPPPAKAAMSDRATRFTHDFHFDYNFWSYDRAPGRSYASQTTLYEALGVFAIDSAWQGYNCSIFAYGQTSAGKTFTMLGDSTTKSSSSSGSGSGNGGDKMTLAQTPTPTPALDGIHARQGLIPRICHGLFTRMKQSTEQTLGGTQPWHCFSVRVSYVEVYHEHVYDLLVGGRYQQNSREPLRVRESSEDGVFVEGATYRSVTSFDEIRALLDEGSRARSVAATNVNERSSRSHAIMTLYIKQQSPRAGALATSALASALASDTATPSVSNAAGLEATREDPTGGASLEVGVKKSKLCLVDLAGSERADISGASGKRLREAGSINRSLSTLADVISALSKRAAMATASVNVSSSSFVPYRNSVLTRLLKESLGGNAKTVMLAAISPCCMHYEETLSTLKYIERAKRVINSATVNNENSLELVHELRREISELKAKLQSSTLLRLAPSPQPIGHASSQEQSQVDAGEQCRPGDMIRVRPTSGQPTIETMATDMSVTAWIESESSAANSSPMCASISFNESERGRMEREIAKLKLRLKKRDRELQEQQQLGVYPSTKPKEGGNQISEQQQEQEESHGSERMRRYRALLNLEFTRRRLIFQQKVKALARWRSHSWLVRAVEEHVRSECILQRARNGSATPVKSRLSRDTQPEDSDNEMEEEDDEASLEALAARDERVGRSRKAPPSPGSKLLSKPPLFRSIHPAPVVDVNTICASVVDSVLFSGVSKQSPPLAQMKKSGVKNSPTILTANKPMETSKPPQLCTNQTLELLATMDSCDNEFDFVSMECASPLNNQQGESHLAFDSFNHLDKTTIVLEDDQSTDPDEIVIEQEAGSRGVDSLPHPLEPSRQQQVLAQLTKCLETIDIGRKYMGPTLRRLRVQMGPHHQDGTSDGVGVSTGMERQLLRHTDHCLLAVVRALTHLRVAIQSDTATAFIANNVVLNRKLGLYERIEALVAVFALHILRRVCDQMCAPVTMALVSQESVVDQLTSFQAQLMQSEMWADLLVPWGEHMGVPIDAHAMTLLTTLYGHAERMKATWMAIDQKNRLREVHLKSQQNLLLTSSESMQKLTAHCQHLEATLSDLTDRYESLRAQMTANEGQRDRVEVLKEELAEARRRIAELCVLNDSLGPREQVGQESLTVGDNAVSRDSARARPIVNLPLVLTNATRESESESSSDCTIDDSNQLFKRSKPEVLVDCKVDMGQVDGHSERTDDANNELDALYRTMQELKTELAQMCDENGCLSLTISQLNEDIGRLMCEVDQLTERNASLAEKNAVLTEQNESANDLNPSVMWRTTQLMEDNSNLLPENTALGEQVVELEEQNVCLDEANVDLQTSTMDASTGENVLYCRQCSRRISLINTLTDETVHLRAELKSAKAENDKVRAQHAEYEEEAEASHKEEIKRLTSELSATQTRENELMQRVANLAAQVAELEHAKMDNEVAVRELLSAQAELDITRTELASMSAICLALKEQLDICTCKNASIHHESPRSHDEDDLVDETMTDRPDKSSEAWSQEQSTFVSDTDKPADPQIDTSALTPEQQGDSASETRGALQIAVDSVEVELLAARQLIARMPALDARVTELENVHTENEAITTRLFEVEAERDMACDQLEAALTACAEMEEMTRGYELEITALSEHRIAMRDQISSLEEANKILNDAHTDIQQRNASLACDLGTLREHNAMLASTCLDLTRQRDEIDNELARSRREADYDGDMIAATMERITHQIELEDRNTQLLSVRADHEAITTRLLETEPQNEIVCDELATALAKCAEMAARIPVLEASVAELEDIKTKNSTTASRLLELEAERDTARSELLVACSRLEEIESNFELAVREPAMLRDNVSTLEQDLQVETIGHADLAKRVAELTASITLLTDRHAAAATQNEILAEENVVLGADIHALSAGNHQSVEQLDSHSQRQQNGDISRVGDDVICETTINKEDGDGLQQTVIHTDEDDTQPCSQPSLQQTVIHTDENDTQPYSQPIRNELETMEPRLVNHRNHSIMQELVGTATNHPNAHQDGSSLIKTDQSSASPIQRDGSKARGCLAEENSRLMELVDAHSMEISLLTEQLRVAQAELEHLTVQHAELTIELDVAQAQLPVELKIVHDEKIALEERVSELESCVRVLNEQVVSETRACREAVARADIADSARLEAVMRQYTAEKRYATLASEHWEQGLVVAKLQDDIQLLQETEAHARRKLWEREDAFASLLADNVIDLDDHSTRVSCLQSEVRSTKHEVAHLNETIVQLIVEQLVDRTVVNAAETQSVTLSTFAGSVSNDEGECDVQSDEAEQRIVEDVASWMTAQVEVMIHNERTERVCGQQEVADRSVTKLERDLAAASETIDALTAELEQEQLRRDMISRAAVAKTVDLQELAQAVAESHQLAEETTEESAYTVDSEIAKQQAQRLVLKHLHSLDLWFARAILQVEPPDPIASTPGRRKRSSLSDAQRLECITETALDSLPASPDGSRDSARQRGSDDDEDKEEVWSVVCSPAKWFDKNRDSLLGKPLHQLVDAATDTAELTPSSRDQDAVVIDPIPIRQEMAQLRSTVTKLKAALDDKEELIVFLDERISCYERRLASQPGV